jgi:integrase
VAATPEEAIRRRGEFLARRRDGFTAPAGKGDTVDQWMRHWLHHIARHQVALTTWENSYRQKTQEIIAPFFERIRLADLAEEDIERWHAYLQSKPSARTGRPLSASTIGQAHRIMSMALKAAVVRGKLPRNPCSNVTPPRVVREEIMPPTAEEVARILQRCSSWPNGARWVLAICTGLRQGEALALEWRHVKLTAPASLKVTQSAARVKGERIVKAPKSKESRRAVPLPLIAVEALKAHRQAQGVTDIGGLVFTDTKGRPVHPRADYGDWHALLDDLGIRHYRVHDLRHGYATMLLEAGEDARVVQSLMGHSTPAFTQKAYQHVRPVMHQRVADAIDRVFGD